MTGSSLTVAVLGATGQQGGATAHHLLASGADVIAPVRDPASPKARSLQARGARVVAGDMEDAKRMAVVFAEADAVFSVQPTAGYSGTSSTFTVADEIRWGLNVADAAAQVGVKHFVYASVAGADRHTGIRRWESKWEIEQHLHALGLPTTVLRPVRFMENLSDPQIGVRNGVLTDVLRDDVRIQLIAVTDIGAFAALAFTHPDDHIGLSLDIAGDELTMPQIADAISAAVGRQVAYNALPREALVGLDPDALTGYDFANDGGGWTADIAALQQRHPGLLSFDAWLRTTGRAQFAAGHGEPPAGS